MGGGRGGGGPYNKDYCSLVFILSPQILNPMWESTMSSISSNQDLPCQDQAQHGSSRGLGFKVPCSGFPTVFTRICALALRVQVHKNYVGVWVFGKSSCGTGFRQVYDC